MESDPKKFEPVQTPCSKDLEPYLGVSMLLLCYFLAYTLLLLCNFCYILSHISRMSEIMAKFAHRLRPPLFKASTSYEENWLHIPFCILWLKKYC